MPRYATIMGIMVMASVGLPLTVNFVGEFLSLAGFYQISHTMTILAGTSIILGAVYMLTLYKKSFFGEVTNEANKNLKDLNGKESMALWTLVLVTVWLGVYPKPVLGPINTSVESLVTFMHKKAITDEAKATIRPTVIKREAE
jgi:NADH-quinone oxidoreductase subunit M